MILTNSQVADLRDRMHCHTSVGGVAVCVVTARELERLIATHWELEKLEKKLNSKKRKK